MIAKSYEEFLGALNGQGFLLFGGGRTGLMKLSDITDPAAWFSGGERDPWTWRSRLCERRDGVYARLLGGQTFLTSMAWYPRFLAAYRRCDTLPERYEAGEIGSAVWQAYELFEERGTLAKHDLTGLLGRTAAEKALAALQREMYVTVSGESQRVSAHFRPVGIPSMEFARVSDWAAEALQAAARLDGETARREIRIRAGEISPAAERTALNRLFEEWSVE